MMSRENTLNTVTSYRTDTVTVYEMTDLKQHISIYLPSIYLYLCFETYSVAMCNAY